MPNQITTALQSKTTKIQKKNPEMLLALSETTMPPHTLSDIVLLTLRAGTRSMLCQKGMKDCKNIAMYPVNANKYIFIILDVGKEAMNMLYECEFTVKKDDLDYTNNGSPTRLLSGQKESKGVYPYGPRIPPPAQPHLFRWILTCLLAVMIIYSCVITLFYCRLRRSSRDPENSLYVVMRNGPLTRNPDHGIYSG
ncbi:hypothetical protein PAMA_002932 [Pampus argenteus]